ncbi:hypothetical protein ACHAXR_008224 [Thalassiosira sp. AJA248-18]
MNALSRSGYLRYILYENLQCLSTTLREVLVTQRILKGVGVGRPGATALAATLSFVIRDGCGIISSLLFTSFASSGFRRDVKRWKFFSAIMLDVGLTLQILASSLSGWFLPLLCLGSICKALYNVTSSPCAGVIKLHWAVKLLGTGDGIAEISAKGRSQKTLIQLVSLIIAGMGVNLLDGVNQNGLRISLYCVLTSMHLVCNKMSLQLIALDWLNGWRLHRVVQEFLKCVDGKAKEVEMHNIRVSGPTGISKVEPVLFSPAIHHDIRMGVSYDEIVQLSLEPKSILESNLKKKHQSSYIVALRYNRRTPFVAVAFFPNITKRETAKAYLHSCLICRALTCLSKHNDTEELELLRKAKDMGKLKLMHLWPLFEKCTCAEGWDLDKTESYSEGYEVYADSLR